MSTTDEPAEQFQHGFGIHSEAFREFVHLSLDVQAQYEAWARDKLPPGKNVTSAAAELWIQDGGRK